MPITPMPDPGPIDVRLQPPPDEMLPFRAVVLALPTGDQSQEPGPPVSAPFRCAFQPARTSGQWTSPNGPPQEPQSLSGYVMITKDDPGAIAINQVIELVGDLDGDYPANNPPSSARPRYISRGEVQPPAGLNRRYTLSVDRYGY